MTLDLQAVTVALRGAPAMFRADHAERAAPRRGRRRSWAPPASGKSTLLDAIGGHLCARVHPGGRCPALNGIDLAPPAPRGAAGGVDVSRLRCCSRTFRVGATTSPSGWRPRSGAVRLAGAMRSRRRLSVRGLAGLHDRDPATLSGRGNARRAATHCGRLLAEPRALLAG